MSQLNTSSLYKLTADCFQRMKNNLLFTEQTGGGNNVNLDSIIPYLISINKFKVTGSTKIPAGLITNTGDLSNLVKMNQHLDNQEIKYINQVLKSKPTDY